MYNLCLKCCIVAGVSNISFLLLLYAVQNPDMDRTSQEVVDLVQEYPEGIPVKQLAVFYSFRYKRNLIVANLGFTSVASFVDSLSKDLLVEDGSIIHKNYKVTRELPGSLNAKKTNSRISLDAVTVRKEGEMTQEELLEKVKEVIKVYPAAQTSITQLLNGYFLHFGSILPLGLYMSLYDNQTSKQQATFVPAQVIAEQETVNPASTYRQYIYLMHF